MVGIVAAPPRRPPTVRRTNGRIPPSLPRTGGGDDPEREPEPRRPILDNARLATMFLIGGEIMLFAGLVSGFFVLRMAAPIWPPPLQPRLPILITGVNTLVLLTSSVTMATAVWALRREDRRGMAQALGLTAALGALFLVVQGYEWVRLVSYGLTMSSSAYGSTFYTVIGAHALHVLGALAWVGIAARLAARGRISAERPSALRACAMYWHFVVALWPVLYVAVYLL